MQKRINELNAQDDERGLEEAEREEKRFLLAELNNVKFKQEAVMYQKARQKWLKQGDLNTKFFHSSIKWRRAIMSCMGCMLTVGGVRIRM